MTSKLIILEGPDGAGKTTLSEMLAPALGATLIRHDAQPERQDMVPYFMESLMKVMRSSGRYVFDRCWYSEPIYGRVLRKGKDRVGAAGALALNQVAAYIGTEVVLCLPPWDVVAMNFSRTKATQLPQQLDQMQALYGEYRELTVKRIGRSQTAEHYLVPFPIHVFDYRDPLAYEKLVEHLEVI